MKILIAGSNGIIGSFLFDSLSKSGFSVSGLDNNRSEKQGRIKLDLTNTNEIESFVSSSETFDVLIFLVALAHDKGKKKDLSAFRLINYQTLVNLLTTFQKFNKFPKKVIFSSTISVYGEKYNQSEYFENSELKPKSPYAITKLEAENFLLNTFSKNLWILRFAPVYSDSFQLNIDRRTKIKKYFYKVGKGTNRLSLLSINNIYTAIQAIIEDKVPQDIYNISDTNDYSFNDLLKYKKADKVITIPSLFVKVLFLFNKLTKSNFIEENSIKLLTDNLYPSKKIQKFVNLSNNLLSK